MAFFESSALRLMTTGETEYDAPVVENSYEQFRENIESLTMLTFNTTMYGTFAGVSSSGWVNCENHIGTSSTKLVNMTLAVLSGAAVGNMYSIIKSSGAAASTALRLKASDPHADGASSGATFKVFHQIKRNSSQHGHDHDGTNSPEVVLATSQVTSTKIHEGHVVKDRIGTLTAKTTGKLDQGEDVAIEMAGYCFFPNIYAAAETRFQLCMSDGTSNYTGKFGIFNCTGGTTFAYKVFWRYITT